MELQVPAGSVLPASGAALRGGSCFWGPAWSPRAFHRNAIHFDHENSRRAVEFASRKITEGAARFKLGLATELRLSALDARQGWGFVGDYVKATCAIGLEGKLGLHSRFQPLGLHRFA